MIYLDTTKSGSASHRSGLMRVTTRLRDELGGAATAITWPEWSVVSPTDWLVTAELFSEAERPGIGAFLDARRCRTAAIFHDAIPLKHPHITWPQSVARHPGYMKLLARFDQVWAVSSASQAELEGFWRWQGIEAPPPVAVLPLGADFNRVARVTTPAAPAVAGVPALLCVGIVEPRKNQDFLRQVCEKLWQDGLSFELHVVGRVNPHFGRPMAAQLKKSAARFPGRLFWHEAIDDRALTQLYARARATVFPTIAEGCGLPLLESLWMGVPCVCSDLPVLRENADGGGCVPVSVNDAAAWAAALRQIVTDDALIQRLRVEAANRPLPTWRDTADVVGATSKV